MKKLIAIILIAMVAASGVSAQEQQQEQKKQPGFMAGFAPYYTFINGLRLDFDFKISDAKNQWLVVSPQFYYNDESYNWDYEEMSGVGFDLGYRLYLSESKRPKGPYFMPGITFQYYTVEDEIFIPVEYTENGNTYFVMEERLENSNLFKTGPNVLLGYQFLINNILYLDLYGGVAFRMSFDNRDGALQENFNYDWFDLGYQGILLNGGMRVGVAF
ncbi:MAG: hypothetical protein K9G67_10990 [Bacteroidales bacterium]|nr:hypothetical protein [Bacteroidales bacterium]MCF8343204.1 hypothetical protein [Bacteroidales bacterium]MCF8351323.1 hypothetical protein [Bacteroidales bacterium]MCF8376871.1 hypothetical protein [Bacteroidales bacterium]MCF8401524.1 hypothetical protein [Bacteroidales bacterium]